MKRLKATRRLRAGFARTRPSTLRARLFWGFGGVGVLVVALLALADNTVTHSSQRLEGILVNQVRPLALSNDLQSSINRIHTLEIELPRLDDYFAVTSQLALIQEASERFGEELDRLVSGVTELNATQVKVLRENWRLYRADLRRMADAAGAMKMDRVVHISTYQAAGRFKAVSRTLRQIAATKEKDAVAAYRSSRRQDSANRRLFIATSVAGLLLVGSWVVVFSRRLSGRVSSVRDAAARVADGYVNRPIHVEGSDELSDLARVFNVMQQKIVARERALRAAQEELESRVQARTRELYESTEKLKREIDERRRAEQQLRLLSQAVEQSPVGVMVTDSNGIVEYVNEAFIQNSGYGRREIVGRRPWLLHSHAMSDGGKELFSRIREGGEWSGEFESRRRDGTTLWERVHVSPVLDASGGVGHYLAIREDITERKAQEEKVLYQAHYDDLTGLPNRVLALERLRGAVARSRRQGDRTALLFIDLDDFKKVNDTLGHETGDTLLLEAGRRLAGAVRAQDTVARHGGDEFLVIMSDLSELDDAEAVARQILEAFAPPFTLAGNEFVISPSIGLAVCPDDGLDAGALLKNADLALYQAKDAGRNTYRFHNSRFSDYTVQRLEMERHLRGALERREMRLVYQPLIDTATGDVIGAEALLRWESEAYGLVPPDQFVPVAEQTGLIVEIGEWVLREACRQIQRWSSGGRALYVAVNVSPRQFRSGGLLSIIREVLEETGLEAGRLQIEITEGLLIRNPPEVRRTLDQLDDMGVQLAMDDFGTGYSSLSYLKSFPFHTLKVDGSFIRDVSHDPDDRALVQAAISMGHGLGLSVVAEGVEDADQYRFLRQQRCDAVQGFYFGRPCAPEIFAGQWLDGGAGGVNITGA
ncbi:MAG: EAL domain-containing protein [Ectothiorhodospiraceae bacterium]|jgi:diguanylate cyclase (GGDEF)-like protein/PAS domain S-box-containing protein